MITRSQLKWHARFLKLADEIAGWSKDSTQVGAVAVDSNQMILSTGYNGFPKEIRDTVERLQNRELKNHMVVHAEMNVIFNAPTRDSLIGSTVYIWGVPPCTTCTSSLIRKGVSCIVIANYHIEKCHEPWLSRWEISKQMLKEAQVELITL